MSATLSILPIRLDDDDQARSWLDLLDHYARDPMGGGQGLAEAVRAQLVGRLRERDDFVGFMAWQDGRAVGLANCFEGFSTFAAMPLLNVHDIVVHQDVRGQGIGQALLVAVAAEAKRRGCCKLTLEVLSNNTRALASYRRFGFADYVLDPAAGTARFMQKPI